MRLASAEEGSSFFDDTYVDICFGHMVCFGFGFLFYFFYFLFHFFWPCLSKHRGCAVVRRVSVAGLGGNGNQVEYGEATDYASWTLEADPWSRYPMPNSNPNTFSVLIELAFFGSPCLSFFSKLSLYDSLYPHMNETLPSFSFPPTWNFYGSIHQFILEIDKLFTFAPQIQHWGQFGIQCKCERFCFQHSRSTQRLLQSSASS